jgi:hypothetical protein
METYTRFLLPIPFLTLEEPYSCRILHPAAAADGGLTTTT